MPSAAARRPAVLFFLGLALGMAFSLGWWNLLPVLPVIWAAGWSRGGLVAMAGLILGLVMRPSFAGLETISGASMTVSATVVSVPEAKQDRMAFDADTPLGRIRVSGKDMEEVSLGDRLAISGVLRAPGAFLARRGVGGLILDPQVKLVHRGFAPWRWALEARESFHAFLAGGLQPRPAALLQALCFGDTGDIDPNDMQAVRRSGAAHLVAASGFNVILVAGALFGIFSFLPIPRWLQAGALAVLLVLYGAAAGFESPIVRAILMAVIHLGAEAVRREPDALSSAAASGVICLMLNPSDVASAGFWLSYVSVFALIMGSRWEVFDQLRRMNALPGLADLTASAVIATLATAPIVGVVFGEIPVLGIATNVVASPICGSLTVASLGLWTVWPLAPRLVESLLTWLVEPLLGFVLMTFHLAGSFSFSTVPFPPLPPAVLSAAGVCLLLAWRSRKRPAREG